MTVARTWAVALVGVEGELVEVEADLSNQTPEFKIIGLPDKALGEAVQRVHNACANSGLALPRRRLTVNLSPASLPKHGSGFDVAIAIAVARDGGADGCRVRRVDRAPGRARSRRAAAAGPRHPSRRRRGGASRASVASSCRTRTAPRPSWSRGRGARRGEPRRGRARGTAPTSRSPTRSPSRGADERAAEPKHRRPRRGHRPARGRRGAHRRGGGRPPPAHVRAARRGQDDARAAAARHPPRPRRSRRARRRHPSGRSAGDAGRRRSRARRRSRRRTTRRASRRSSAADPACVRPGRDRARERGRAVPRRGGRVPGERARRAAPAARDRARSRSTAPAPTAQFPARFQLVLATNPCPCGDYGVRGGTCTCPPMAIRRYLGRLSGPLLDRIDIELTLARVSVAQRGERGRRAVTTAAARGAGRRGAGARAHRGSRDTPWRLNAQRAGHLAARRAARARRRSCAGRSTPRCTAAR